MCDTPGHILLSAVSFPMLIPGSALPHTTGMRYKDQGDEFETVLMIDSSGQFQSPPGGWGKDGRRYVAVARHGAQGKPWCQ